VQEARVGKFFHEFKSAENLEKTLVPFSKLCENEFVDIRVMQEVLPAYANWVFREKNIPAAAFLVPFGERLVAQKGTAANWYLLSLLYYSAGEEGEANNSVREAIELKPHSNNFWNFLHYLNIREASRKTGRPLEEFFSNRHNPELTVPEYFYDRDQTGRDQQDL
jgi:hypothetical protein